ncbi:endolytic transglycosylase MltG [Candidatus Palauibacter sp.]|uniref:endolytic transglycosylase MltG n=1 Tax=Candidatus Palauibacter sp. TaxID=3101350 RepID=UPI003B01E79E
MSGGPGRRQAGRCVAAVLAAAAPVAYGFFSTEFRGVGPADGSTVEIRVPEGVASGDVAQLLETAGLIGHSGIFDAYVRLRGEARSLKAGRYEIPRGAPYAYLLWALHSGAVGTTPLTIPEGFGIPQVADRLAAYSGDPVEAVQAYLTDPARVSELGVPGPTLEGYLFPETYRFAEGVGLPAIVAAMVGRYDAFWGEEERTRAATLGLDEREIVTLASIVEKEVRKGDERTVVAGVYWNRLQRGMLLQADPTVHFALGEPRSRLLYRDIDAVADHPYNTYTQPGLPPGPIASPGAASLRAALQPAEHEYIFFVARNDGSHEFTRTLREHNAAISRIRLARNAAR